jgi:DNA-binding transcriptional regulator YiaG
MPRVCKSNIPSSELRALVERSGLTISAFARAMGSPVATLNQQVRGHRRITPVTLNAARFTLLRLGYPVTVEPIHASHKIRRSQ